MTTESKFSTTEDAVRFLRRSDGYAELIRDSYLDENTLEAANRFRTSAEFAEACKLLGPLQGKTVLDLGAGTGIASYAFARTGAARVIALEPDPSGDIGRGAIARIAKNLPIEILDGKGEGIPLADECVDIVYARQVLHHAGDLKALLRECYRILRRGGVMLSCREHVVTDGQELEIFLNEHPVHQLVGGEHAYTLATYSEAFTEAGFHIEYSLGPWDSVINAFPTVRNNTELNQFPSVVLTERFGTVGKLLSHVPGISSVTWRKIKSVSRPGRLYSFLAAK